MTEEEQRQEVAVWGENMNLMKIDKKIRQKLQKKS